MNPAEIIDIAWSIENFPLLLRGDANAKKQSVR
jgi:hypothetical protein